MITAFYSFKGGVGRSMALANIGDWFASQGARVVMIDWDLEAPGLETYFSSDKAGVAALQAKPGLMDLLEEYRKSFLGAAAESGGSRKGICDAACRKVGGIDRFLQPIDLQSKGSLWLMNAGGRRKDSIHSKDAKTLTLSEILEMDEEPASEPEVSVRSFSEYASLVQAFDWTSFLQLCEGEGFFQWFREQLIPKFADIVLIDSRTGVTEMGGVCTRLLADLVVCFLAPNRQNREGTLQMVKSFRRADVLARRAGKPEVMLAPSRVEDRAETTELRDFKDRFRELEREKDEDGRYWFSTSVFKLEQDDLESRTGDDVKYSYLRHTIPYFSVLSYQEALVFPHPLGPARVLEVPDIPERYAKLGAHIALHAPENSGLRKKLARAIQQVASDLIEPMIALSFFDDARVRSAQVRERLLTAGFRLHSDIDHRPGFESRTGDTQAIIREARCLIAIVTADAAARPAFRDEIRYARELGKSIYLLQEESDSEARLPGTFYKIESDWERLVRDIQSPAPVQRAPNMAPPVDSSYISPMSDERKLTASLLSSKQVVVCAGAGFGKTALASYVCGLREIQDAFPDGILWMTLRSATTDFLPELNLLFEALTGAPASFLSASDMLRALAPRLSGRLVLVIDDVWSPDQLERLPMTGSAGVRLILTRNRAVSPSGAETISLGPMDPLQASWLFSPPLEFERAREIAKALYCWPILLSLARKVFLAAVSRGVTPDAAAESIIAALERHGPSVFDDSATTPREGVSGSLQLSLDRVQTSQDLKDNLLVQFAQGATLNNEQVQRLANFCLLDTLANQSQVPAYLRAYLEKRGLLKSKDEPASAHRVFKSQEDHKRNPDVLAAKTALNDRAISGSSKDVRKLIKNLKDATYFGLARNYIALARRDSKLTTDAKFGVFLQQQHALCTYKDDDLPIASRLDRALEILRQPVPGAEPFDKTRDPETLGIAGAIHKAKWKFDGHAHHLEEALKYYETGFKDPSEEDFGYNGINAAYVLDLLACLQFQAGQDSAAQDLRARASAIRRKLIERLPELPETPDSRGEKQTYLSSTWWFLATLAEACFGLGMKDDGGEDSSFFDKARYWLIEAKATKVSDWEYASTSRQFIELAQARRKRSDPGPLATEVLNLLLGNDSAALANLKRGRIGLALSGGGFRAALFHIGVLARLAELDLLKHIEALSCVSGGSVLGAHYYLKVQQALTADGELPREAGVRIVRELEDEFLAGVRKDLRNRLLAEWSCAFLLLFSKKFSQTERLGELFEEEIYKCHKTLPDLVIHPKDAREGFSPKLDNWKRESKVPILILNATTLNTGHNWQFAATFMGEPAASINTEVDAGDRLRRMYYEGDGIPERYQKPRLGHAVAASAAVPMLFDPLEFPQLFPKFDVRLSDGGAHDNQGIASLLEQHCDVLLVSDASGQMATVPKPSPGHVAVGWRANNILMERVRWAEFDQLEALERGGVLRGMMFVHLKKDLDVNPANWIGNDDKADPPDNPVDPLAEDARYRSTSYGVLKHVQRKLAALRTDLDSFTDQEAYALMLSGYRMVNREFETDLASFPADRESPRVQWNFQRATPILDNPAATTPLLDVGGEQFFKPWRIFPTLRRTIATLALLVLVEVVWFALAQIGIAGWTWTIRSVWVSAFHLAVLSLERAGLVGGVVLALVFFFFCVSRFLGVRRTPTQFGLALFLFFGGSLLFRFYLRFLNPLYLARGLINETGEDQKKAEQAEQSAARPLRWIASAAYAAVLSVALLLGFRFGNPFSDEVAIRVLQRYAAESFKDSSPAALADYRQAIHLAGSLPPFEQANLYAQRAYIERVQGDYRSAVSDLQHAVQLYPDNAQHWRDLGFVFRLQGEFARSYEAFATGYNWHPDAETAAELNYSRSLAVASPASAPEPVVYIHVADASLVPRMSGVMDALKQNYRVAPVQVNKTTGDHTVLSWSDAFPVTDAGAAALKTALENIGIKAGSKPLPNGQGVPQHYELWIGKQDPLFKPDARQ